MQTALTDVYNRSMRALIVFGLIVFFVASASAMRVPESLNQSLYSSDEGFTINPKKTAWLRSSVPNDLKGKVEVLFRMKSPSDGSPTFTVRIDKDITEKSLKEYTGKWLKGFGQFGLEIMGHKYFKNKNNELGFFVDITNSTSKKKMRQAIFFKNSKAVILTCMDQAHTFKKAVRPCNELIHSFSWNESTHPTAEKLTR